MVKNNLIWILGLLLINVFIFKVSAYPLGLYPLNSTNDLQPNTLFNYTFNFTTDISCNNVILSNNSVILTNKNGAASIDINISSLTNNQIPSYLCEYRDGTLRKVHILPDMIFRDIYARNGNFTQNVSADWFHGKLNYSDLQNVPAITLGNTNISNSSIWWYGMNQTNSTQFNIYNGVLTIFNISWSLITNSPSLGDNASWNQTLANSLYYSISNPKGYINSSFNTTYDSYVYANYTNNSNLLDGYHSSAFCFANGTNSTGGSCATSSSSSSNSTSGFFVNYTIVTTTGNITNGSLSGYLAGNSICNVYFSGSHMCTINEILDSIGKNISNQNFTGTFRASMGAPGYLANANDCNGWTSQAGADLGSIWVGSTSNINTFGSGSLVSCSALRSIGCCK